MAKIVIDARELRTSTGRYVERLLFHLQKIDKQHKYTVLLKPADMAGWQPTNPHFSKLACPFKEFTFAEQLGFLRQLNSLHADLVHFPLAHQPVLYQGKTVTAILDLTTARFRNPAKNFFIFSFKQLVYKWLVKRVAKKSAKVIAISKFAKDDIAAFCNIPKDKISVIYPAADDLTDQAEPIKSLVSKQFIMYVGRPLPHKNLGRLVDSFVIIQKNRPDLWLVLAGKKDILYERYEKDTKKRGLKNILFTDFVNEGQLRWLYEHTAAYVFPSLSEGFGLPGLEAMTTGAPVVSSSATCLPEVYDDAAHYFDPLDIQDMVAKINQVLDSEKLRTDLIKKGHTQAKKYSWSKMASQTLAVYNQALNK